VFQKNVYPKKFTKNDQPTIQIVYKKVLETPSQKHQSLVFFQMLNTLQCDKVLKTFSNWFEEIGN